MRKSILISLGVLVLLAALLPAQAAAGTNSYMLRSPSAAQAQAACQRYGLQMVRNLNGRDVYLVKASDSLPPDQLKQWVKGDSDVKNIELDSTGQFQEDSLADTPNLPTAGVNTSNRNKSSTKLYGSLAWVGYVQQPLLGIVNASTVQQRNITGAGIVAIIDTGVDPHHPVLAPYVIPGYDFTRDVAGSASELADLNQSTAAILEQNNLAMLQQSTAAILEGAQVVHLNQSTAAILEQSTAAILEGQQLPAYFGHGTMVAGLVHLIAPTAQIMPLKAFKADGSSRTSDIVRAIHYATDNGASVINMSFSLAVFSDEVMRAINYASRNGVVCVASVGNEGQRKLVYPAAFGNVVGVGSTSMSNQRSAFSNFGVDLVVIAAPGESLVTTYPGGHYAAVWGTSFSSAVVAGGVALLLNAAGDNTVASIQEADAVRAFSQAVAVSCPSSQVAPCAADDLGAGRLDLNAAVSYIRQVRLPEVK